MYSPELMRFLIGHDIDNYETAQKQSEKVNVFENKIFRYTKYATIPIEIKE